MKFFFKKKYKTNFNSDRYDIFEDKNVILWFFFKLFIILMDVFIIYYTTCG